MPATKTKPNIRQKAGAPKPKRPEGAYPGYMTDEWFEYAMAMMKRETPAKIKRDLVKFGILDKKGHYSAPYRND